MLQLSQGVAGEEQLFMQNALAVYFDTDEDSDPTYVSWIKERNLPLASRDRVPSFVRTRSRGDPRLPNDREVRALIPALQTVNGFLSRFRRDLEGPILIGERLEAQVKIPDGRMIDVYWPGDE
jgi:hypothetical protein